MGTLPAAFAGAFSVFDPPLSETPSTHPQAPEKSRNRNTKNQAANTQEIPSSKLQTAARASSLELGAWNLELFWGLELGVWWVELGIWSFHFPDALTLWFKCA